MNISKGCRQVVYRRDGNQCLKCGTKDNLSIDHIVPKSLGGINNPINYQTLCKPCNTNKGNTVVSYVSRPRTIKYLKKCGYRLKTIPY